MKKVADSDLTLPSVVADLDGSNLPSQLMLTISFHPDTSRIGESVSLALDRVKQRWKFGRKTPEFRLRNEMSNQSMGRAIEDPHISRNALEIEYHNGSVRLDRTASASRCQVGGVEVTREMTLSDDQLKAGVAIFLAHRVVLLLRKISADSSVETVPQIASGLIGSSPYMGMLRRQIASVAKSKSDVLIRGETGAGKELVASAIHANGASASGKLVPVNMSAIPAALAPAALFGNAKGAFTGADSTGVGYFEQAAGGVLFLDEVGETPLEIQAQLLRALQQREIQPVGGRVRRVELRVVAATDSALDESVDFKAALRHRLGACEIVLQALREHPEDIGELLYYFLQQHLSEAGKGELSPRVDSDRFLIASWAELFHKFIQYSWPGNVRQLSNFAQQVALASDEALQLPPELQRQLRDRKTQTLPDAVVEPTPNHSRADIGEDAFLEIMASAGYEPARASRLSGIPRTTIYRLIESSTILQTASQVPEGQLVEVLSSCDGDIGRAATQLQVSMPGLRSRLRTSEKMGR